MHTCETGRPWPCDLMTSLSESDQISSHCVECWLCTPRRPRDLFTEIGTTLHIGWVLEYYLSYACVLLLIMKWLCCCDWAMMWCDLNCWLLYYYWRCVASRGRTGRWCYTYLPCLIAFIELLYLLRIMQLTSYLFVFGLIATLSRWSYFGWLPSWWRRSLGLLRGVSLW